MIHILLTQWRNQEHKNLIHEKTRLENLHNIFVLLHLNTQGPNIFEFFIYKFIGYAAYMHGRAWKLNLTLTPQSS